jgi:hypothetical protein
VRYQGQRPRDIETDRPQEHEYAVVRRGVEAEQKLMEGGTSYLDIFRGVNWRRTVAGCVGICSQWTAGAPIVFGYSTYFFKVANLGTDPFLITVIT